MTVTNKPGHRGEHEGNRKTIAQGMPVETGEPVEDYRILCGHGCIGHPAFPAPSCFLGRTNLQNSGAPCRENEEPRRHSGAREARAKARNCAPENPYSL